MKKSILFILLLSVFIFAEKAKKKKPVPIIPGTQWHVHDMKRPKPEKIKLTSPSKTLGMLPPKSAKVLFGSEGLKNWATLDRKTKKLISPKWKLFESDDFSSLPYAEIIKGNGYFVTKKTFGDIRLHLEFAHSKETTGEGQNKGNSGVFFMKKFEVQILDSHKNETYADGQCAALYGQYPPDVNASLPIGEWQTYDIFFLTPKWKKGKLVRKATVTVYHNGVKVHDRREFMGPSVYKRLTDYSEKLPAKARIRIQDNKSPVRFRNIWVKKIKSDDPHEL